MLLPVVVGVGDVKNKSERVEDAIEPMQLMLEAVQLAIKDTEVSAETLQSNIDSIDVVRTWTWPYPDLPGLLAEKLGVNPLHKHYTDHGGHQPGKVFDDAARRISKGQCKVAVVIGGEAQASLTACAASQKMLPLGWTKSDQVMESAFTPTSRERGDNLGDIHGIGAPIHVYPLYENGFRAHRKQSLEQNNGESAVLYAEFAKIAERQPYSWNYEEPVATADFIRTVSKRNRMICFSYPVFMNAFNTVNMAAGCILTSTDFAKELGIPECKWIYPLGGAGTRDSNEFWKRPNYFSSPSISLSLDAALEVSGLRKEQIDLFDFYPCFPIVPKLAAYHLGLPITGSRKPITLLGGLTSFGGAGNNYSMHALTEMVRQLREGNGQYGLVLANGGVVTYHHAICLSSQPKRSAYPNLHPSPTLTADTPVPVVDAQAEGAAVVETFTVEFDRDGRPVRGFIVGRLKRNGHRFVANNADSVTMSELLNRSKEPIGREGWGFRDCEVKGRNLFGFDTTAKL